jgi:hypothetical protein
MPKSLWTVWNSLWSKLQMMPPSKMVHPPFPKIMALPLNLVEAEDVEDSPEAMIVASADGVPTEAVTVVDLGVVIVVDSEVVIVAASEASSVYLGRCRF